MLIITYSYLNPLPVLMVFKAYCLKIITLVRKYEQYYSKIIINSIEWIIIYSYGDKFFIAL